MARGRQASGSNKTWRRGNGKGSVYKLSGNRRNPWVACVPGTLVFDEETLKSSYKQKILGYYPDKDSAEYALDRYLHGDYSKECEYTFNDIYTMWTKSYFKTISSSAARTIMSAYNYCSSLYFMNFGSISIKDMEDCIEAADVGYSTKNRMKSLFNLMYDFAIKAEIVDVNKARNFTFGRSFNRIITKEKKDKIPISAEHIEKIFERIDYGYNKMIIIGLYTGLRPQELCLIKRENVFLDDNIIVAGMKTEAGTDRRVPIHPKIKEYVEYYYTLSEGHKYLIKSDNSNDSYMTYDKYRGRFKKSMELIGAAGLYSPHCTRHTFITNAKKYGVDEYALKLIVGHAISDITESVYTHRTDDFIYNEICKIK